LIKDDSPKKVKIGFVMLHNLIRSAKKTGFLELALEITSSCINLGEIALSKVMFLNQTSQQSVYALNKLIDYQTIIIKLMKKSKNFKFSEITAIFLNSPTFSETCQSCMKIMGDCSINREDYVVQNFNDSSEKERVIYNEKKITILNKNFKIVENMMAMPKVGFLENKVKQQPYYFVMNNFKEILTLLFNLLNKNTEFFSTRIEPGHCLKKLAYSILRIVNSVTKESYEVLYQLTELEESD
jgi:hypothetical protein